LELLLFHLYGVLGLYVKKIGNDE
jgi:hypothetical protein